MKVAFVVDKFPVISQTFILDQITGLIDFGVDVEIYADSRNEADKVHPDVKKYKLQDRTHYTSDIPENKIYRLLTSTQLLLCAAFRHPFKVFKFLFSLVIRRVKAPLRLLCWIKTFFGKNFDIIHCHFAPIGLQAVDLKEFGIRGKLVTTFHGYDVNRVPLTAGNNVYKRLFKEGDLFTSNTNFTKSQAVGLGCNENKIKILPVGLRIERFTYKSREIKSEGPVKILTVGRLVEKKGHEYAIKAIKKLFSKFSNVLYLIAGDGELKEQLQSLVAKLALEKQVDFLGPLDQEELLNVYQQAHIFVLPSVTAGDGDREGQGLVLQEAQAVGLPVISTFHNGIPDGVLDGKSGFLVPEKDADALAEKLEYLILHPEVWSKMGKCGQEFVRKNYDIKVLNKRLIGIYSELLSSKD